MSKKREEPSDVEWQPPSGRWSPADGGAMLVALAASGQTLSAFARRHGLPAHRVSYWRARLGSASPASPAAANGGFVAVTVRDTASAVEHHEPTRAPRIEVTLVNGRRVMFAGHWDVAAIGPWLRALEVA